MPEALFDEWIAPRYATLWPELFDPAVVDPAVDFLADLAGAGAGGAGGAGGSTCAETVDAAKSAKATSGRALGFTA